MIGGITMRRFAAVFLMLVLVFSLSACCFQLGSKQAKYTASFTTYIHNRNLYSADSSITSGDLAASQRLTDTYAVIIKSNQVLNSVFSSKDLPAA